MKLLITGAFGGAKEHIPEIEAMGHEVVFMQQEKDELPADPRTIEGVIGNGIFLHHPIEAFTSLRFIQLTAAGFDRVPMEYAVSRGIAVRNARGVYSFPMAEFALAGVLALYKRTILFHNNQKNHEWVKMRDLPELGGRNAAVFGCGSVGIPVEETEKALAASDIIICTLPLLPETVHFFDDGRFSAMKDGAVFVNISRGAVVDTEALIRALRSGKLMGAVLDVFEEEPLSETSPLWDMENVLISPHNSFSGEGNRARLWEVFRENLREFTEK